MAANRSPLLGRRLDSWKEIATVVGRSERTVKRWETERGLPVHRVPGSGRSSVFAYSDELADWLKGRSQELETDDTATGETAEPGKLEAPPAPVKTGLNTTRVVAWLMPPALALGLALILSGGHPPSRLRFKALASLHAPNAEAQDLYLKGRYYWDRRTPDDLNKAVDYFTQAIVKDPSDAAAYAGLGR